MTDEKPPLAFQAVNHDEKPPLAFQAVNHVDVVRVALAMEKRCIPALRNEDIIYVIMKALGGKANPTALREEIARQRKV